MNKLTLGDVCPIVAPSVNLCASDGRVRSLINRAEERLMGIGDWLGTFQVYQVCLNNNCLVWPRPVERITLMDVCGRPISVRTQWYEFLENGPGFVYSKSSTAPCAFGCGMQLIDRGQTCLYSDISSSAKKLKIYADLTEGASARITFRGYDENQNWIQTEDPPSSDLWIEGEKINLSGAPIITTKKYAPPGPLVVLKDVTKGPVRVYSYDDSLTPAAQQLIAVYEPGETRPTYRRSFIPGLQRTGTNGECVSSTVTALVKLRHIDAVSDLDTLVLQSTEAFRLACQAIRKEENNLLTEANLYWYGVVDPVTKRYRGGAVPILQEQLDNYIGSGTVHPIRYEPTNIAGAAVPNLI